VDGDDLTKDRLRTREAVLTLGALAAKKLLEDEAVVLHLGQDGVVQVCPLHEVQLDGLEEDEALKRLLDRGYNDDGLIEYLKGRTARGGS
jgi:hypothetical protein